MKKLALPLFLLLCMGAFAQTTYTMPGTFICDAAVPNGYHITSFSQFQCRGIELDNSTGQLVGSFFWFNTGEVEVFVPGVSSGPFTNNDVIHVVSFARPKGSRPGRVSFDWQETDSNGAQHTGIATGKWVEQVICGGRGCQWVSPKLLAFETTAD